MTFQTACGLCQGQLLVETPGIVVECPHCGAHLAAPDEPAPGGPQPTAFPPESKAAEGEASSDEEASSGENVAIDENAPTDSMEPAAVQTDTAASAAGEHFPGFDESAPSESESPPPWMPPEEGAAAGDPPTFATPEQSSASPRASVFGTWEPGQAPEAAEFDDAGTLEFDPQASTAEPDAPAPVELNIEEPAEKSAPSAVDFSPADVSIAAETPKPSRATGKTASVNPAGGVPRGIFVAVLSYASAVTLALIYLLIRMGQPNPHQLESLPDLPPPESNAFHHIREDAQMAPHHTLKIGESRRFGNVRVTPLKVTREPLQLVHYSDRGKSKATSSSVLKLWLEFENESEDQTFSPLDLELMLRREYDHENPDRIISNNFVCRKSDKVHNGRLVHVYPLNPQDQWDLKDHTAGQDLRPGEKKIVYIPTGEAGVSDLSGDLVWRVHFRKGHNPTSGRGVTTVIEVVFHSNEISSANQQTSERRETALTSLR